jgi:hypothetical protein
MKRATIAFALSLLISSFANGLSRAPNPYAPNPYVWYQLQTMSQAPENKCFEGNRLGRNSTLGGAAFMADCQNASGQRWQFEDAGNGYYRMKTLYQGPQGKCFESNRVGRNSTLNGASFMANCKNASGQLWKVIPALDGHVRLTSKFLEKQNMCLEGNRHNPGSFLHGAAFMDTCQNVSGQLWKLVPVD